MAVGVGIHWKFQVLGDVDLFAHADAITESLLAQESKAGVVDSAVSVDRRQGIIEIEVSAVGDTENEAIAAGQAAVMAAIRSVGGDVVSLVPTDLSTTPLVTA